MDDIFVFKESYERPPKATVLKEIKYKLGGANGDCWVCVSHRRQKFGYHAFQRNGKQYLVHRYVFEQANKREITKGMHLLHKCDNPDCINPDHLFEGTNYDNVQDKVSKGRQSRGSMLKSAKLTESDVIAIKKLLRDGVIGKQICEKFGISSGHLTHIKQGRKWKHITLEEELN